VLTALRRRNLCDPQMQLGKLLRWRPAFEPLCHGIRNGCEEGSDRLERCPHSYLARSAARRSCWSG